MSRNKIKSENEKSSASSKRMIIHIWILFLVALLSIQIAHAQSKTFGQSIILVLINSVIVGVILFILQAFLIKGKDGKEMTVVYVVVIAASLLIGFLFGSNDYIWRGKLSIFFDYHVLGNAIIIALAVYFLMGLLKVNEKLGLGSMEGKTSYGIFIFALGVLLAVQLGNHWVWEQQTVAGFVDYFFGKDGVFNPNAGLPVFLGAFFLLSFFFNGYLLEGGVGGKKGINYGLAFLFAMSMARGGTSLSTVIIIGEIVFVLLMQKVLNTGRKYYDWLISIFIIGWASSAVSASLQDAGGKVYKGILGGIGLFLYNNIGIKGIIAGGVIGGGVSFIAFHSLWIFALIALGIFLWKYFHLPAGGTIGSTIKPALIVFGIGVMLFFFGGIALTLLVILAALFLIFGGTIFAGARGERRHHIKTQGLARLKAILYNMINKNETALRIFGKFLSFKDPVLENELLFKLKDLRFEVYNLMNYFSRFDVYYSKSLAFGSLLSKVQKEEAELNRGPLPEGIGVGIKAFVEGSDIVKIGDAWDYKPRPVTTPDGNQIEEKKSGFGRKNMIIYKLITQMKSILERDLTFYDIRSTEVQDQIALYKNTVEEFKQEVDTFYHRYNSDFKRYGIANLLRSYRLYFIDMYNWYGTYKRGYFFARHDAIPDYYEYEVFDITDGMIAAGKANADEKGIKRVFQRQIAGTTTFQDSRRGVNLPNTINLRQRRYYNRIKNKKYISDHEKSFIDRINAIKKHHESNRENYENGRDELLELDIFGWCISDVNAVTIDGANYVKVPYIRKYHKEDMIEVHRPIASQPPPRFLEIYTWSKADWDFFVEDMQKGSFHPYSRKIEDYGFITELGLLDYSKAPFTGPLIRGQTAFDREGLKRFQKFEYWGRRNFYDVQGLNLITQRGSVDPHANPYPTISIFGMLEFIRRVVTIKTQDEAKAREFLDLLQMEFRILEENQGGQGGTS